MYSAGESEVLLGKMLKQHNVPRESVVIMTKTYAPVSQMMSLVLAVLTAGRQAGQVGSSRNQQPTWSEPEGTYSYPR